MSGVSRCVPWTLAGINRHPAPPASRVIAESRPDAGITTHPPLSRKLHCARKNALSPPSKPRKVVRNLTPGKADGVSSTNSRMLFSMRSSLACWSSSDSSAMDARSAPASCAYSSASAAHDSASWQSGGTGARGATCAVAAGRAVRRQLFGRVWRFDRVFCAAVQGGSFLDEFNLAQGFVFDAARYLRRS